MQSRDVVFIITEETRCPLYNVGEELQIEDGILSLQKGKSTCLVLASYLLEIVSQRVAFEQFKDGEAKGSKFECGGCAGIIRFEFKVEKEFATQQMKLLVAARKREKFKPVAGIINTLKSNETFKSLSDDDLLDLAKLLDIRSYDKGATILQKGNRGENLCIILAGRVAVVDDDGVTLSEIGKSELFGEVSLLSGDRVTSTVIAKDQSRLGLLSRKNFQHILKLFPVLQVFFYKLQAKRITEMNLKRAEELASGMVGHISDIPTVELCQMLNANMRSGHLQLDFYDQKAVVLFHEGEVVDARLANKAGEEAFYDILTHNSGRFKFVQGLTKEEQEKEIIGGFMGLLLEGMKRLDDLNEVG